MEIEQAIKVIRALANGVHPESGAALEENSICRAPDAIKALNRALAALVAQEEREKKRPKNAKKCARGLTSIRSPKRTTEAWPRFLRAS
jgi:hypothetical protein